MTFSGAVTKLLPPDQVERHPMGHEHHEVLLESKGAETARRANPPTFSATEERVLVFAPNAADSALNQSVVAIAGLACQVCPDFATLGSGLDEGAGAILLTEEALAVGDLRPLVAALGRQPSWSDVPILMLSESGADSPLTVRAMELFGNITVVERPARFTTLVSALRSALRARRRQYELRDQLDAARRSTQQLRLVIDSLPVVVTYVDRDFRYRLFNRTLCEWFGLDPEAIRGQKVGDVLGPAAHELARPNMERALTGETVHFEAEMPYRFGAKRAVEVRYVPDVRPDGAVEGYVGLIDDISERKRAEEELKEADRRKDEFLATLAHELRNPLAPIRNSLHLLRLSGGESGSAEKLYEIMERQVGHMVRLVDDLMEVSRITRGKIELRKGRVELAAMIRAAVETARPMIDGAGHQLAISVPSEPLVLEADSLRLAQVFANLLNNAAKYTHDGGQIWLTALQEGDEVVVSVRDSGVGIPAEMLSRVFDIFTQVDRTQRSSQGGLGIGLTVVQSLVQMHGGRVEAASPGLGQGSVFTVRLPLAPREE
ncbi:MAG TPA: PAS domain-containing sensor histidine kinase, partial [Pirellulales bacterium]|nr:PAS domain-containing sensor histidine kinase [Pirellulales bacterium]